MEMNKVDKVMEEIRDTQSQLKRSWEEYNNATGDYIDVAILQLKMYEKKYTALCKELKNYVLPKEQKRYCFLINLK